MDMKDYDATERALGTALVKLNTSTVATELLRDIVAHRDIVSSGSELEGHVCEAIHSILYRQDRSTGEDDIIAAIIDDSSMWKLYAAFHAKLSIGKPTADDAELQESGALSDADDDCYWCTFYDSRNHILSSILKMIDEGKTGTLFKE